MAILAIAAIATVLAVSYTAGLAQAQGRGGGTGGDPTPSAGPLPCGPGQAHFPENPAAVVSGGHYALFDAYWQLADGLGDDDANTGTLNANLCPPSAAHKDVTIGGKTIEQTTRSKSNIDLGTTIIHVDDTHKVDVVATNGAAGTTKLSLDKYTEVRAGLGLGKNDPVPAGTEVYWLRLEDPGLGVDPSSLVLGFSTGLLDEKHWDNPAEGKPTFEYEFESYRVLGANPADLPHVFTYWEPELRKDGKSVVVWDSTDTDTNAMPQEAGEYEHLEWVFTEPGTYVLSIHLKGHVRQNKPSDWNDAQDGTWKRLDAADKTVTSVPRQYVFQVGNVGTDDQPHFGALSTVRANAAARSQVGADIPMFGTDGSGLHLRPNGYGHEKFAVKEVASDFGKSARITLADNANLRFGGRILNDPLRAYYDLHLRASEEPGGETTGIIPVRIHVLPAYDLPWLALRISDEHPQAGVGEAGDTITITAEAKGFWRDRLGKITLYEGVGAQRKQLQQKNSNEHRTTSFTVKREEPGMQRYSVVLHYDGAFGGMGSGWYPVIWHK